MNSSKINSLLFGAYSATAVLTIYTIVSLFGAIVTTATPIVAGGALFVTLTVVFLSVIARLRSMRKGARKSFAVIDTYAALAVLTVLGYFLAACVQTFQPGVNPSELWSAGTVAAIFWACLFAGGKYAGELFRDGGKN